MGLPGNVMNASAELELAALAGSSNVTWRRIYTDSESLEGVAPRCPHQEKPELHPLLVTGEPDEQTVYDCCPGPFIETGSEALASRLVQLMNREAEDQQAIAELGTAKVRFWVCPIREHRGREGTVTVEWRDDVAHCTAPDCGRTSAKG